MKLDISLLDLQNFSMTKVNPLENMSKNKGKGKVESKLGVETTSRTNLGETIDLIPYFFHVYCNHLNILFHPQFC
jgi:hypothetical protein